MKLSNPIRFRRNESILCTSMTMKTNAIWIVEIIGFLFFQATEFNFVKNKTTFRNKCVDQNTAIYDGWFAGNK